MSEHSELLRHFDEAQRRIDEDARQLFDSPVASQKSLQVKEVPEDLPKEEAELTDTDLEDPCKCDYDLDEDALVKETAKANPVVPELKPE